MLFTANARRLDDRPPFVHLGLLKRGKTFRRLLIARRDVEAELREARFCTAGSASACTVAALSLAMHVAPACLSAHRSRTSPRYRGRAHRIWTADGMSGIDAERCGEKVCQRLDRAGAHLRQRHGALHQQEDRPGPRSGRSSPGRRRDRE